MTNFNDLMERSGNGSMKWDATYIKKRFLIEDKTIYPLFISDMDYNHAEVIQQHFIETVQSGDFGYFTIQDSFYNSIIEWHKKQHDLNIRREWILAAPGTLSGLHFIIGSLLQNKNVLVFTPVYGHFQQAITSFATMHNCPLAYNGNQYTIDFNMLEEQLQHDNIEAILFCNPHNPSGKVWRQTELETLVKLCRKYDILLIADEIHSDVILGKKKFVSLLSFSELYDKIIISTGANKTFNLSGLSTSYILSQNKLLLARVEEQLNKYHIQVNRLGIAFTQIAYEYGAEWVQELIAQLHKNLAIVKTVLAGSGIEIMEPEAGYLVWMRLDKVKDVEQFVRQLAAATGVLVESGERFIADYQSFIRINIATSSTLLQEACTKLKTFYCSY
ncbi:MalY/PatB family protein [Culicoidibacter larvae]|uniref:cysteine-S-conjugate beta-lyase n=1 Tax=Culicoidibacter larvae TaxID=2579976 RepID=A0A5R8Q9Y6_9FIRM|nr:aminotransferase class I/II-fold pyridoxal phosphate-dependent enzyme [Culicoidibacter larvae]TLG72743.1 aminotransferase class I/II-fold pyridoxal phosphate-dependent enzyme [Culicoidibacter larvae]